MQCDERYVVNINKMYVHEETKNEIANDRIISGAACFFKANLIDLHEAVARDTDSGTMKLELFDCKSG